MQTLINKINSTLSMLKNVDNSKNLNIALFHAVTLENENTIGFKFTSENINVGDYDHFEHNSKSATNKDLVYLMIFKSVPDNVNIDSLFEYILKHNDLTRNSRDTIQKSFNLDNNGFDINISEDKNSISLFKKSPKEHIGTIKGKEAQKIIDNAKQFTKYCGERFSETTALRAAINDIIENEF